MFHESAEKFRIDEELKNEEIANFWENVTGTGVSGQLNCELHRREEINLYYQCTQNTYNHYSLDHFGGEMRSFPRWIHEYMRCNMILFKAECCSLTDAMTDKDYECPPCTHITMPMPEMFGDTGLVVTEPEPPIVYPTCGPLPDVSMLSVYRYKSDLWPLNSLIKENSTFYCIEMKRDEGSTTAGTLNVKMPGNNKLEPNYNIKVNHEDCSIDIKSINEDKYTEGRKLQPYGAPFNAYDAFSFEYSSTPAEKYDAKVGYCTCDQTTGACEGHFDESVENGFM